MSCEDGDEAEDEDEDEDEDEEKNKSEDSEEEKGVSQGETFYDISMGPQSPPPPASAPSSGDAEILFVAYEYVGSKSSELTVAVGERVTIVDDPNASPDWILVEKLDGQSIGQRGYVPRSFLSDVAVDPSVPSTPSLSSSPSSPSCFSSSYI